MNQGPPTTVHFPPHTNIMTEQQPLTDRERRQAVQGPLLVAEEPPAMVLLSPQTNVERQPEIDTEYTETAQEHALVAEEPPTMVHPSPRTNAGRQREIDAEQAQGPLLVVEEPPATVGIEDLDTDDILIAVIGPTGSGKSTFVRLASGCDTQGVGHTLRSFTSHVTPIRYWDQEIGRHVVLVDTPGFDHTCDPDLNISDLISDWLNSSYEKQKLFSGILYLHRITNNRVASTPLRNLRLFRKLCGRDSLEKVYLTATMWDEVDQSVGERRLEELKSNDWKAMIDQGARTECCRSDDDSAKKIIRRILNEVSPKALLLQGEMADLKKELKDTERTRTAEGASQGFEGLPAMVGIGDLETDDIIIAVMGPTGSGKSTFVRLASGCDTPGVGHALRSFTSHVAAIRYWNQASGRYVVLVDTPGFDHTYKSDLDILDLISEWLNSSYKGQKLFSGILYLHRIINNRMADTLLKNLRVLGKLCGGDVLEKVYLTTTMWDEVDQSVGERRLEELKSNDWKAMIDQGAQTDCWRSDDDSAKKIIRQILDKEVGREALLLEEGTEAGPELYSQLEKLVEKQMALLQRINEEMNVLAGLQTEYNDLRVQIDDKLRQMQGLKLSPLKNLFRLVARGQG
ncbi:hypothetical protein HD554DRAFT_2167507 [Boletus coccyginus]|nr:hypothetical protein HD554DRAFT_2167507 [Boletus coccyginus]